MLPYPTALDASRRADCFTPGRQEPVIKEAP